jgi:DNA-binding helix-hairpin-helix protein with protein kinase domain
VVDLKPVNLRFYRRSLYMAMLDCDGFSIHGDGERFAAPQYTPEYLAPEFQLRGLTEAGELQQDRFALAVVVFQLLNFGIHPFTGRPASDTVPSDIPGRIAGRWYGYGLKPEPAISPSPASGHAHMPNALRAMFDRAFSGGDAARPTAGEWSSLLRGYAQRASGHVVVCGVDAAHQHFAGQACAACARGAMIAEVRRVAASLPKPLSSLSSSSRFARPQSAAPPPPPSTSPSATTPPPPPTGQPTKRAKPTKFTPPNVVHQAQVRAHATGMSQLKNPPAWWKPWRSAQPKAGSAHGNRGVWRAAFVFLVVMQWLPEIGDLVRLGWRTAASVIFGGGP